MTTRDRASKDVDSVVNIIFPNNARRFSRKDCNTPAWHHSAKRLLDIFVALMAIIVLIPLLLFVCAAIRIDSRGPVLFTQSRWGAGGCKINVIKFRSMFVEQGDPTGVAQTTSNDVRVTRVGRVIRRYNIDELPQLLNVLKGEMSLVGPRCHAVGMLAAGKPYEKLVPEYHRRHVMRPGMTGLAQMRGWRGPTDSVAKAKSRIASDLHYVENFSIWLDLYIIARTIKVELTEGKGF